MKFTAGPCQAVGALPCPVIEPCPASTAMSFLTSVADVHWEGEVEVFAADAARPKWRAHPLAEGKCVFLVRTLDAQYDGHIHSR